MARRFTEQFKKDALSYVHDHSDYSVNACARNLGISSNTLHGWVNVNGHDKIRINGHEKPARMAN